MTHSRVLKSHRSKMSVIYICGQKDRQMCNFKNCIQNGEYVENFKKAKVRRKMMVERKNVTTNLSLFFQMLQMFTKRVSMMKSMIFLKIYFRDVNADFVRVSIPKMHFFSW